MSSGSSALETNPEIRSRRGGRSLMFRALMVLLCASVAAGGCRREPGDLDATGQQTISAVSVGPVPGPGPDEVGRPNPFGGDRAASGAGRRLFQQFNCAGCHGEHAGGGMGPSLRDIDWIYGSADAQVFSSIAEGRAHGMPAWHTKLEADQMWRLVAYIKSLRTRNEPEPPIE